MPPVSAAELRASNRNERVSLWLHYGKVNGGLMGAHAAPSFAAASLNPNRNPPGRSGGFLLSRRVCATPEPVKISRRPGINRSPDFSPGGEPIPYGLRRLGERSSRVASPDRN
jgi:hypothetical protein